MEIQHLPGNSRQLFVLIYDFFNKFYNAGLLGSLLLCFYKTALKRISRLFTWCDCDTISEKKKKKLTELFIPRMQNSRMVFSLPLLRKCLVALRYC